MELPRVAGERQQVTKSGFVTRSEAQRALNALLTSVDAGIHTSSRQTAGEYLDAWYQRLEETGRVRRTTLRSYRGHLDRYLLPHLGHIRLSDLRPQQIEGMYRSIRERRVGDRPLSAATVRRVHATLRSALNSAVKRHDLAHNPALHVDLPPAPRPQTSVWTVRDYVRFLDAIKDERLYALFVVAGQRGLRRGELLGLRWKDIQFDRKELRVTQQLVQLGHATRLEPPKTDRGRRVIPLDSVSIDALRSWKAVQAAERLAWGPAYTDDGGLVFTRQDGRPLHPESVTKLFHRLTLRAGIPVIRLHDLRHTSATLGLQAGEDMRLVSRRLGHSSIAITVDTYTHVVDESAREAAERMAELLARTRGSA